MARTLNLSDPNLIGKIVYQGYSPRKAGKIVRKVGYKDHEVETHGQKYVTNTYMVEVKWLKGPHWEIVPLHNLRDLKALIEETEKKLETHLKTMVMARGL